MKKIDEETLKRLKLICYEVALMGVIDAQTMSEVKAAAEQYLDYKGYTHFKVKCDYEINSPDVIDSNKMYVDFYQKEFPGSTTYFHHRIEL